MAFAADRQDQAFTAHILDLFTIAQQKYVTRFTGFLDMHQLALPARIRITRFSAGIPAGNG